VSLIALFSRRLYLRIWLAVVVGVAVLTLLVGWAWRVAAEQMRSPRCHRAAKWCCETAQATPLVAGLATRAPGSSAGRG